MRRKMLSFGLVLLLAQPAGAIGPLVVAGGFAASLFRETLSEMTTEVMKLALLPNPTLDAVNALKAKIDTLDTEIQRYRQEHGEDASVPQVTQLLATLKSGPPN